MSAFTENFNGHSRGMLWGLLSSLFIIFLIITIAGWYVSLEPDQFDVEIAALKGEKNNSPAVTGWLYVCKLTGCHC